MIRKQFILIFLSLVTMMSGCGQSGPLYLPPEDVSVAAPITLKRL